MIAHPFQLFPVFNGIQHYSHNSAANVEIIFLCKHFIKNFFNVIFFTSYVGLLLSLRYTQGRRTRFHHNWVLYFNYRLTEVALSIRCNILSSKIFVEVLKISRDGNHGSIIGSKLQTWQIDFPSFFFSHL